ncbi:hypothetical protein LJC11_03185 [Bacteroidales bacterium OttesenSCG-928-I21]|nr:hypothetical protein [Bacteroidales bacterium OttesenSCG-928-I21]
MKKLAFIFIMYFFCSSCITKDRNFIYQSDREWIFDACFYNEIKELTNIIEVKMKTELSNDTLAFVNYEYNGIKQGSSFVENQERVSFVSPKLDVFAFTPILPYPAVSFPPSKKSKSTITSENIGEYANKEELDGLTFLQKMQQQNETENFEYNGTQLLCYKIEGWNTSHVEEFGQYKVTYFFNERFGFVRFLYEKPDGSIVDMRLKQTNFD